MLSNLIKFAVEGAAVFDSSFSSSFYVDTEDDPDENSEVVFCKNNVCVHLSSLDGSHVPGYFILNSKTRQSGHVRLLVTWTPNSYFCDEKAETNDKEGLLISELCKSSPEVFNVDLSEMKTLRLFYKQEDQTCGQLVIGNFENHYKVFHFHHGGLDRITQIFQDWIWCSQDSYPPDEEELRRKSFTVISKRNTKQGFHPEEGRFDPMPVQIWKTYFNEDGQIEDVANFRKVTFFGGLSPEVRKEAWKFLLQYFPFSSTTQQRELLRKDKEKEYHSIDHTRQNKSQEEKQRFWKAVQCTVDKDVVRTDRSHPYFAGDDNPNVDIMRNILLNYATHNPEVGYNQGMSDLLASVLAIVQDEVDAFWCFVGLMEGSVFVTSPKDDVMDRQLTYFRELLRMMVAPFYAHLLLQDDAMDMLFCHRWLLLSFKREFFNEEVLKIWEACWSRYQTEYFHIFLCVAMVQEYGGAVVEQNMASDEMLQYFTDLSMKMDGTKVLRTARQLLLKFRQLPGIPCSLRGLLSGPGVWDSAPLPEIQCSCHNKCLYLYGEQREHSSELIGENENDLSAEQKESEQREHSSESIGENEKKISAEQKESESIEHSSGSISEEEKKLSAEQKESESKEHSTESIGENEKKVSAEQKESESKDHSSESISENENEISAEQKESESKDHSSESISESEKKLSAEQKESESKEHSTESIGENEKKLSAEQKESESKEHSTESIGENEKKVSAEQKESESKEHSSELIGENEKKVSAEQKESESKEHSTESIGENEKKHSAEQKESESKNHSSESICENEKKVSAEQKESESNDISTESICENEKKVSAAQKERESKRTLVKTKMNIHQNP